MFLGELYLFKLQAPPIFRVPLKGFCLKTKKDPLPLLYSNPAFFLFSTLIEVPFLSDTNFYTAIIGFWVLISSFFITHGRGKVNNNKLFWE
jgi:hypothetical protein